jgi:hypothetical protein
VEFTLASVVPREVSGNAWEGHPVKTVATVGILLSMLISLSAAAPPITTLTLSVPVAAPQGHETGDQGDERLFTGKIVLLNGELFILRDDTNGVWYHLDDQTTARKFAGKNVNVKGKLDVSVDVIHVQTMEEQKN